MRPLFSAAGLPHRTVNCWCVGTANVFQERAGGARQASAQYWTWGQSAWPRPGHMWWTYFGHPPTHTHPQLILVQSSFLTYT